LIENKLKFLHALTHTHTHTHTRARARARARALSSKFFKNISIPDFSI